MFNWRTPWHWLRDRKKDKSPPIVSSMTFHFATWWPLQFKFKRDANFNQRPMVLSYYISNLIGFMSKSFLEWKDPSIINGLLNTGVQNWGIMILGPMVWKKSAEFFCGKFAIAIFSAYPTPLLIIAVGLLRTMIICSRSWRFENSCYLWCKPHPLHSTMQ